VTTTARRTIAVIDDDCRVRESLDDLLDCAGFRVRLFASGAEFLCKPRCSAKQTA